MNKKSIFLYALRCPLQKLKISFYSQNNFAFWTFWTRRFHSGSVCPCQLCCFKTFLPLILAILYQISSKINLSWIHFWTLTFQCKIWSYSLLICPQEFFRNSKISERYITSFHVTSWILYVINHLNKNLYDFSPGGRFIDSPIILDNIQQIADAV